MNRRVRNYFLFYVLFCLLFISCKEDKGKTDGTNVNPIDTAAIAAITSELIYTGYQPLKDKPIKIYYHVPANASKLTPILFVFNGTDRNAKFSRDLLTAHSDRLKFIIIAPEFSDQDYPGADGYNLGNMFVDGDNPTASTIKNEEIWTFSVIEPIFNFMKVKIGSTVSSFDIFGHSAGGQFAHRYLLFKPSAKLNKLVAAASGWYTMFDNSIDFPYGTKKSSAEFSSYNNLFNKKVFIIVGDKDTDPNSADLRHNDIVDKQGLNRFTRAQYFYSKSREEATRRAGSFNWKYNSLKDVTHDFAATSAAGVNLLYQ